MSKLKDWFAKFKTVVIVALIVFVATSLGFTAWNNYKNTNVITGKTIQYGLNNISELQTAEYYYTHVTNFNSGDRIVAGLAVPFTTSKFICSYDGVVKAGIDFAQIEVEERDNVITVKLPKAEIQSSEVIDDSFKLYDQTNNIFNPISVQTMADSLDEMKSSEEANAIENGLLDRANDNAKNLIDNFLKTVHNIDKYEIRFVEL